MELWTNEIDVALEVLGCALEGNGERAQRDLEGTSFNIWGVTGGFGEAYAHCLFEAYASGSQFDRLRSWKGNGIFAVALDGSGFHGRQGRAWQCCEGNLYLSVVLPASVPVPCVNELRSLPGSAVIGAVRPLMSVVPLMKAPNDVVVRDSMGRLRKLAGSLTEVSVSGNHIVQVRYGIGIDVWGAPEIAEPGHLLACSVREYLKGEAAAWPWGKVYRHVLESVLAAVAHGIASFSGDGWVIEE
ncbi:MAG: hypothetical protein IJ165_05330 [Proteobacteria bacterium]|nr:hypothetical protein [Pseudomonadota bacterium]